MKHALFLPPFGPLAEPAEVVDLAVAAEGAGWDGLFLWDHVTYRDPAGAIADPWIVLAAVAQATTRLRLGTMVTPLPRRRPQVLARQLTSLDRLSDGRLTLGVGIGGDGYGEFSAFGDEPDARTRGAMLDEELDLLVRAWTGQRVEHDGEHHRVDGVTFTPTPVQQPHPPLWAAARFGSSRPLARAARLQGVFPIGLDGPDDLRTLLAELLPQRADADAPFDVCVNLLRGTTPEQWAAAGATWCVAHVGPFRLDLDELRAIAAAPPPAWTADPGWD